MEAKLALLGEQLDAAKAKKANLEVGRWVTLTAGKSEMGRSCAAWRLSCRTCAPCTAPAS